MTHNIEPQTQPNQPRHPILRAAQVLYRSGLDTPVRTRRLRTPELPR